MRGYPGHKNIDGVFHTIINNIPFHEEYFEIFAGSGVIANKLFDNGWSGTAMHINDIDVCITAKYKYPGLSVITNKPAVQLLAVPPGSTAKKFFFLDPPYLLDTRTSKSLYNCEMSDSDHVQLLAVLQQSKHNIMIIHPTCDLYDSTLSGWRTVPLKIRYNRKTSLEQLYMNYDVVKYPMITAFLGADCWKRQRIKRNSQYNDKRAAGTAKLF